MGILVRLVEFISDGRDAVAKVIGQPPENMGCEDEKTYDVGLR